ncbi:hypothetical protein FisN_24Lh028 [Fistulifera solaris]|uniref:Uncharacterized protein n=1 Tax=Fistulifera solaris TaxID=1519565 RepID=A0A1Z5KTV0_FISSO|nr:hypothetical protein FisN_24Lh028 [Fistulifera solaris]|eukprot:GAX29575.1 hypothetical protein FisN_24Lh028 [Fistulifera solaris]
MDPLRGHAFAQSQHSSHKNTPMFLLETLAASTSETIRILSRLFDCFHPQKFPDDDEDDYDYDYEDFVDARVFRNPIMIALLEGLPQNEAEERDRRREDLINDEEELLNVEDPIFDYENSLTPLEYIVYHNEWQVLWGIFLKEEWDPTVHPAPLKDSFHSLRALLKLSLHPEQKETRATLFLIEYLYYPKESTPLEEIQKCLATIDPTFDWQATFVQPLKYKQSLLQSTLLPDDVRQMIWSEHVQPDVLHQAIRQCAWGVVIVSDEAMSQAALNGE